MSEEEKRKVRELLDKIKEKGIGFDRDALLIIGTFAFCKEAKEYGGSLVILDKMIKLLDEYPNSEDFIAEAGELIGV